MHSYIANADEDPGVDYRMASTFAKNIRILDLISHDNIIIHMHSIGGNWNDGMAIFDAIKACESHVTIIAYGQAESMSSIILQAADSRIMMPNAYLMCHFGSNSYCGSFLDAQNTANKYFKENYTAVSEEKVKNFLRRKFKEGDWYLTSHEAVYYGLSDHVLLTRRCPSIESLKK